MAKRKARSQTKTPQQTDPLAKLLQTSNADEQAERVRQLIALAGTPTYTLCIQASSSGNFSVISVGAPIPFDVAYSMLDRARDVLREKELQAVKAEASKETPDKSK